MYLMANAVRKTNDSRNCELVNHSINFNRHLHLGCVTFMHCYDMLTIQYCILCTLMRRKWPLCFLAFIFK